MENPFKEIKDISFLDLGCSGSLDQKWAETETGFLENYLGESKYAQRVKQNLSRRKTSKTQFKNDL